MATPHTLKLLLDDANRSNEGPPPSNNWTNGILTFVAGEGLVVLSNTITRKATGGFRQGSYWSAADFGPNVELVGELSAWTNTQGNELAMYVRLGPIGAASTDGYALFIERGATTTDWSLLRVDNVATTSLGSAVTQAVAAGDLIAVQAIGSELRGFHKPSAGSWAQIVSASDSTYTGAGKVGIEITNNQQTALTNVWAASLPASSQSFVAIRGS